MIQLFGFFVTAYKKSLNIPKWESEFLYRRRTDNTMANKKVQKDKQRSTKHAYKTKDRATRTPLKTDRMHVNNLERGFVKHLADQAIQCCLKGHLCNLGIQ